MGAVSAIMKLVLRGTLPYPDPLRRRRVRRVARALIADTTWPGDGATTTNVAELALLRLLRLQQEAHRAARGRQAEAVALLARASIETCIAGRYWLHGDDEVERMSGNNAKSFGRLLFYLTDSDPITPGLVGDVVSMLGPPTELPSTREMAQKVATVTGESFATDAYHRMWVPLSTFYPHPTGLALLRHVDSNQRLTAKPARAWTISSAVHVTDACMARLAESVARSMGRDAAPFTAYRSAHMSRTSAPLLTMARRSLLRSLRLSKLPAAYHEVLALRRYYDSGQAARDSYDERKARTDQAFRGALQVVDLRVPQEQQDAIIDNLSEVLVQTTTTSDADGRRA